MESVPDNLNESRLHIWFAFNKAAKSGCYANCLLGFMQERNLISIKRKLHTCSNFKPYFLSEKVQCSNFKVGSRRRVKMFYPLMGFVLNKRAEQISGVFSEIVNVNVATVVQRKWVTQTMLSI